MSKKRLHRIKVGLLLVAILSYGIGAVLTILCGRCGTALMCIASTMMAAMLFGQNRKE